MYSWSQLHVHAQITEYANIVIFLLNVNQNVSVAPYSLKDDWDICTVFCIPDLGTFSSSSSRCDCIAVIVTFAWSVSQSNICSSDDGGLLFCPSSSSNIDPPLVCWESHPDAECVVRCTPLVELDVAKPPPRPDHSVLDAPPRLLAE